jgi:dienelactone hydrolase
MTIATHAVHYEDHGTALTGMLAWERSVEGPQPGILLIHGGAGLDDHAKAQAQRYAELGYAVLACDMYGAGVAGDRERVMACLTALRDDPVLLLHRASAGIHALSECVEADGCVAAIGFCFGGMAALRLACSGADLEGVVSVHGSLATSQPAEAGAVKAKVLVCHGSLDPHVPMSDVVAFAEEMDRARADWQLIVYGGAMHGFTHEHAVGGGATAGVEYEPRADQRSFEAIGAFLSSLS